MKVIQYKSNDVIHKTGEITDTLELIISGKVEIRATGFCITAKKGAVLGIFEYAQGPRSYEYVAVDDVTLASYPYTRLSDVNQIVSDQFSTCDILVTSAASQVMALASKYRHLRKYSDRFYQLLRKSYAAYKDLCTLYGLEIQSFPFLDSVERFVPEKDVPEWLNDYYDQLEIMPRETKLAFFGAHSSLPTAAILEAASHSHLFLSLCNQIHIYSSELVEHYFESSQGDLFDLYHNLEQNAAKSNTDECIYAEILDNINDFVEQLEDNPLIAKELYMTRYESYKNNRSFASTASNTETADRYKIIENSLDTILKYTNLDEAEEERFRHLVMEYRACQDKNSSTDDFRKLRLEISKSFYDIYETAILTSFESAIIPMVLKMFFYFGYIDEHLIGKENAVKLYQMAENIEYDGSRGVYTIYDWLKSIYDGKTEPSKNEFDQDFPAYLKSQRIGGYISEEMEKRYLASNKEKLCFEIRNFFKSGMKITSGRPTTFCPLLSAHNIIKPLENTIVTAEKIMENWDSIRNVDYSCFFREVSFQAPEYRISRDTIMLEVLPSVILMPTIGSRGGIWQETSGARRDTPARMFLPIFTDEDLSLMQIRLAAEFRWEICKKIQGARWNDVTDHSLTSEYFDYLQFYRKNPELSTDAKEKLKTTLTNCKNSFRNVFVMDYILWIKYEALGSPRVNKVAKGILFTYCPFAAKYRKVLASNPMYGEMIGRHDIKTAKKHKLLSSHYLKIKAEKGSLPREIEAYLEYLVM